MLQFIFLLLLFFVSTSMYSQTTTDWKLTGNSVSSDSKLGTKNGYDLIITTNNSERMRLTDGGNLGIGIATPDTKLHLVGDFKIIGNIRLGLLEDYTAEEMRFTYITQEGILKSGGSAELAAMVYKDDCKILPNGNYPSPLWKSVEGENYGILHTGTVCPARVGIGLENPTQTLDVWGSARVSAFLHIGSDLTMGTGYKLRIGSSGPSSIALFNLDDDGRTTFTANTDDGSTVFSIQNHAADFELFKLTDVGQITLRYNGPVVGEIFSIKGIEGNDMFSVVNGGLVYCQGLFVKHAPFFPDYVFNDDYKLLDLYTLEVYINTHRHLPNVPTAENVEQQGADIYELNRLLLEKVEELTLYAIDLQKQIDALKVIVVQKD